MSNFYIKLRLERAQLIQSAPDANGQVEVTAYYRMVDPSEAGQDPVNYGQTKPFRFTMDEANVSWSAVDTLVNAEDGVVSTYP